MKKDFILDELIPGKFYKPTEHAKWRRVFSKAEINMEYDCDDLFDKICFMFLGELEKRDNYTFYKIMTKKSIGYIGYSIIEGNTSYFFEELE